MITGQFATHTLWLSTTASPAGIRIMSERKISAGLRRNSCASLRNAASLAGTLTPTEPSRARSTAQERWRSPFVLSLRRHDPDQVQRVFLSPATGTPRNIV